jgi:cell wall-associated NlpC family hydrolase
MNASFTRLARMLSLALVVVLAASCVAAAPPPASPSATSASSRAPDGCPVSGTNRTICTRSVAQARSDTAARAIKIAFSQLGRPYCNSVSPCAGDSNRFGHGPQRGYDCSGLIWRVYRDAGVDVGANLSSSLVSPGGVRRSVPVGAALPGDILGHPGHVVILLADGRILEAPKPGVGVRIASVAHRGFNRAVTITAP